MSKDKFCTSIDDVYGAGWFSRNREELEKYEWEFRIAKPYEKVAQYSTTGPLFWHDDLAWSSAIPSVVILGEKKPVDKITEIYGKPLSEIKIPEGWDYAGEFRVPSVGEEYLSVYESRFCMDSLRETGGQSRLILCKKKDPIEEVYGRPLSELKAPEGFEFTGEFKSDFNAGDFWLNTCRSANGEPLVTETTGTSGGSKRLALRKLPPPPTIASVYGTEDPKVPSGWVKTGEFRFPKKGEAFLDGERCQVIGPILCSTLDITRLILRRVTLTDIYGSSTVTLPAGYDWTGEFRFPTKEDEAWFGSYFVVAVRSGYVGASDVRLILRPTTRKKVRFVAEASVRVAKKGEWYFETLASPNQWCSAGWPQSYPVLCGTREETPDLTPQVVTQADVDKIWEGK